MVYKYACTIEFNSRHASEIAESLKYTDEYDRTRCAVESSGGKVFIKISAKDITALRAAMNDYARLIRVCEVERWLL